MTVQSGRKECQCGKFCLHDKDGWLVNEFCITLANQKIFWFTSMHSLDYGKSWQLWIFNKLVRDFKDGH